MSEAMSDDRAQWRAACPLADIPEDGAVAVELDGVPVCLVRTEGQVFAVHDVCSHEEVPLSEGDVDGTTLECWLHGSRFDLATGAPTGLPATEPVAVYDTKVDGETVCVNLAGSAGDRLER